ncbi:PREDICTED: probable pectate lyase P56 [Ipomoea nil]|uniref:probable pectate lyase P56 n=1 Tax=Ipomoea nil TaxID=35883 RepID=UPI000901F824|nr:PREDICTED: probable pectate lyase P56 [Ipomoea nil]
MEGMHSKMNWWIVVMLYALAAAIPVVMAHTADHNNTDIYWVTRKAEAMQYAKRAYNPYPELVTSKLTKHISKMMNETRLLEDVEYDELDDEHNSTRRSLMRSKRYRGPCKVTNPIDRCWRCDRNWAKNRKKLASCALGFGAGTTGGKRGPFYVVTNRFDDDVVEPKRGTLRHAVIQAGPLWITFAKSMTIRLKNELLVTSDKTIDGRGAHVRIAGGAGLTLQFAKNIIITNLKIRNIKPTSGGIVRDSVSHKGLRTFDEGDGITIFGSSHVWIDHVSMKKCDDGIIDAVKGSTAVTISNCHFTDHHKVLLFGANNWDPVDKVMQITVAFNHFGKRLEQRMPRCRWGMFHIVNNDYTYWEMYALGGSAGSTIISQGNRFRAPKGPLFKEVTHRDCPDDSWKKWTWVSDGDVFLNGAFFRPSGDQKGAQKYGHLDLVNPLPGKAVGKITKFAGLLRCKIGKPC